MEKEEKEEKKHEQEHDENACDTISKGVEFLAIHVNEDERKKMIKVLMQKKNQKQEAKEGEL